MDKVFEEIESMGAYDPMNIILDNRFFRIGCMYVCNANLKLDKTIFVEGETIQHPNIHNGRKIKPVECKIKYAYFEL